MMLSYASLIIGSLLAIFFLILAKGKGKNVAAMLVPKHGPSYAYAKPIIGYNAIYPVC